MFRLLALLLLFNFALGHFHDDDCDNDDSGQGSDGHFFGPGPFGPGPFGPGPFGPGPFGPGPLGPGPFGPGPLGPGPFGPGPFGPGPNQGPEPFFGFGPHHGPGDHHGPEHHHGPGSDHGPGHHHGPGWGHPWHKRPAESDFDKLSRYVISTDKKVLSVCKQSPYSRVKVLAGVVDYSLKYSLPEFNENGIKVQIKHRVISVTAEAQGIAAFKDLRIIPDIVKTADASWFYHSGTLTVRMPYKNPLNTEVAVGCTSDINETVIDVPNVGISDDDLRGLEENLH